MMQLDGQLLRRGDDGYERARCAAVRKARTPERFPEVIVLASSESDVVAAVRLAVDEEIKIGVRSGGHSWTGGSGADDRRSRA